MINNSIFKKIFLSLGVIFLVSCDSDFSELGSNIIEDDIHHNNIVRNEYGVTAYNRGTGAVQTNNLPLNSLGIYNNPFFGKTTSHFVTQVKLAAVNPTFTTNVSVDTVYLYVPYFSKATSTNSDGTTMYELDSIYGNPDVAMRLNVYENRFFLRDSDAGESFLTGQKYYSNDYNNIHDVRNTSRLNNSSLSAENDQFKISAAQVQRKIASGTVVERFAPGIFLHLDNNFFKEKIVNSQGRLVNQNVFKEWFRGVYFNIEDINGGGAMATMDFSKGKIVMIYKQDMKNVDGTTVFEADGVTPKKERKTLEMNMAGTSSVPVNTVNLFRNDYNSTYLTGLSATDNKNLFIKGGEGSLAFVDLDYTPIINFREEISGEKVLINEANLTFYVDEAKIPSNTQEPLPLRLYLYDVVNKRPIYDYYSDVTTNSTNTKRNKSVHGGILQRDKDGRRFYKIRITDYINSIVNRDSVPTRLAVSVTETINFVGNAALKEPINAGTISTSVVPAASVISPLGIILHGSSPEVPEDKRLKLEIFYTKPN